MAPQASSSGHARIKGYTKLQRMAMLTFSLIGLQQVSPELPYPLARITPKCRFTWAVEMTCIPPRIQLRAISTNGINADFEPHLLKLGFAKSQTSLVWIAPPLSGLVVQPIIGVWSDSSQLRWGRRRPFMLLFSVLVAFFLASLAWASEIVAVFTSDETSVRSPSGKRFVCHPDEV